jgi:predicted transcriptional regulator
MATLYNKVREKYCIIPNAVITNTNVGHTAKMLYIYMLSKPDDWEFRIRPMALELKMSFETVRKYLNELIDEGWISRGDQKILNGQFANYEYIIHNVAELANDVEETIAGSTEHIEPKQSKREKPSWYEFYDDYVLMIDEAITELANDEEYRIKYESWFENIDYTKTIIKTSDWWRSTVGWDYAKNKKKKGINMVATLRNNLDKNKIYKSFKKVEQESEINKMDKNLELFRSAREGYGRS